MSRDAFFQWSEIADAVVGRLQSVLVLPTKELELFQVVLDYGRDNRLRGLGLHSLDLLSRRSTLQVLTLIPAIVVADMPEPVR